VQRMGVARLGNGEPRRTQRLGRHLSPVEVIGERPTGIVGAVQVAVELLEVEQLFERGRSGELGGGGHRMTVSASARRRCSGAVPGWAGRRSGIDHPRMVARTP
jgi:hypothetical protein